jgi:hypothetical protein
VKVRAMWMLVAVTAVLAVGCGDDGGDDGAAAAPTSTEAAAPSTTARSAPSTTTLPDPCTLVTLDDAVALAGTALDPGVSAGTPDDMSCTFTGPTDGPTAQVELFVGPGADKYLDVDRSLDHDIQPLAGVGDEAYIEEFNVFFRTGNRWNVLRLTRLDDFAAYRQPMIDLATKIAAA